MPLLQFLAEQPPELASRCIDPLSHLRSDLAGEATVGAQHVTRDLLGEAAVALTTDQLSMAWVTMNCTNGLTKME